jgi:hypothetical protein
MQSIAGILCKKEFSLKIAPGDKEGMGDGKSIPIGSLKR